MLKIYYDGECPFCQNYVKLLRLKKAAGEVVLVDVRTDSASCIMIQKMGFDLDVGMVVEREGEFYHGDKAVNLLARMSSNVGFFNRFHYLLLSNKIIALMLYPILRLGRNLVVFLLGKKPIRKEESLDSYHVFAFFFGFATLYHSWIYILYYYLPLHVTSIVVGFLGMVLMFKPNSKRIFAMIVVLLSVDGFINMPTGSNHTIMLNFFVWGIVLVGLWQMLFRPQEGWSSFFKSFAPIGRSLLICMYFFGIFHKINTGYLNPDSSCAVALIEQMFPVFYIADLLWVKYVAIYSTFIIEGFVMFCLLTNRMKHIGVVVGVLFHVMLVNSTYGFYVAFSSFSIMLHSLFLPEEFWQKIRQSNIGEEIVGAKNRLRNILAFALLLTIQVLFLITGFSYVFWLVFVIPQIYLIIRFGANDTYSKRPSFVSKRWIANLITILFVINCSAPYIGIKSKQSLNMFANLHLENGENNHLILNGAPYFYDYMDDVVEITAATENTIPSSIMDSDYRVTYYALLNYLERDHELVVSFARNGELHEEQSYQTLKQDIESILHSRLVRKWLQFSSTDLKKPKPCSLRH